MMGQPASDPELMFRILIVGYRYCIRSERRLFELSINPEKSID